MKLFDFRWVDDFFVDFLWGFYLGLALLKVLAILRLRWILSSWKLLRLVIEVQEIRVRSLDSFSYLRDLC